MTTSATVNPESVPPPFNSTVPATSNLDSPLSLTELSGGSSVVDMLMGRMNQMRIQNEAERARNETERARNETEMAECLSMLETLTRSAMSTTSMTHDKSHSSQPNSTQHYHAQSPFLSESANVPALDRRLRLNSTGDFVEGEGLSLTDTRLSNGVKRKLSGWRQSFQMEDQVQDRRNRMSFKEVTSKEKMEVTALQLPLTASQLTHQSRRCSAWRQ